MTTDGQHRVSSVSLYRGHSRVGIGEGPGKPVIHGEQYLDADPAFAEDQTLFDAARVWMTFDFRQGDVSVLGDRIEGWSYFVHGNWRIVVRLTSAGVYDQRAAYFAHARGFDVSSFSDGTDPGSILGASDVFAAPWRDSPTPPDRQDLSTPPQRYDVLDKEGAVGIGVLSHLLQARAEGRPLAMLAPITDFAVGSPLPRLISFARSALPAHLKRDCQVRVFTRYPSVFLQRNSADFVVVPDDLRQDLETQMPRLTVLDRSGHRITGPNPSAAAVAYAESVIKRAQRLPQGLLHFAERFARAHPEPDGALRADPREVSVIYNLAAALNDSAADLHSLWTYLRKTAGEGSLSVEWRSLLSAEEVRRFPRAAREQLLLDVELDGGLRSLQDWIVGVEVGSPSRIDPSTFAKWWDAGHAGKLHRLGELLANSPTLLDGVNVGVYTPQVSLARLRNFDRGLVVKILEAERAASTIQARDRDADALAELASGDAAVVEILVRATEEGCLGYLWAARFLTLGPTVAQVEPLARAVLRDGSYSETWRDLSPRILRRLLEETSLPPSLQGPLTRGLAHDSPEESEWRASALTTLLKLPDLHWLDDISADDRQRAMLILSAELFAADLEDGGRERSLAVLTHPLWERADHPQVSWNDWQRVVRATGSLNSTEAERLIRGGKPTWPWIPPLEGRQLLELVRLAGANGKAFFLLGEDVYDRIDFRELSKSVGGDLALLKQLSRDTPGHRWVLMLEALVRPAMVAPLRVERESASSEVDTRPLDGGGELADRCIAALLGKGDTACWRELSASEASGGWHPLDLVVRRLDEVVVHWSEPEHQTLTREGWNALRAAAGDTLLWNAHGGRLPVLELSGRLLESDPIGVVALRVVAIAAAQRADPKWWNALYTSLAGCPRRGRLRLAVDSEPYTTEFVLAHVESCWDDAAGAARLALGQPMGVPMSSHKRPLIFFGDQSIAVELPHENDAMRIFVCSPDRRDRAELAAPPGRPFEEVRGLLGCSRQGGMVAELTPEVDTATHSLRVATVLNGGFQAPGRCLLLKSDGQIAWLERERFVAPVRLSAGESVIVPVDLAAQQKLETIVDALSKSSDLRVNFLRSLEAPRREWVDNDAQFSERFTSAADDSQSIVSPLPTDARPPGAQGSSYGSFDTGGFVQPATAKSTRWMHLGWLAGLCTASIVAYVLGMRGSSVHEASPLRSGPRSNLGEVRDPSALGDDDVERGGSSNPSVSPPLATGSDARVASPSAPAPVVTATPSPNAEATAPADRESSTPTARAVEGDGGGSGTDKNAIRATESDPNGTKKAQAHGAPAPNRKSRKAPKSPKDTPANSPSPPSGPSSDGPVRGSSGARPATGG